MSASVMKLAFNFFAIGMIELFGELMTFTDAWELDTETVATSVSALLGHPAIAAYLDRISRRSFHDAGFELITGLKDVELMLAAAHVELSKNHELNRDKDVGIRPTSAVPL